MLDEDHMIKLADWCKKNGIHYLTGYRWFKNGKMPVNAYQTASGTILVEDIDEVVTEAAQEADTVNETAVSQLVKKAFDLSKAGAPVEDLATYVISNFKLEKQDEAPQRRSSRMKPTKEMTNSHFKKFMKPSKDKSDAKMFIPNAEDLDHLTIASDQAVLNDLDENFSEAPNMGKIVSSVQSMARLSNNEFGSNSLFAGALAGGVIPSQHTTLNAATSVLPTASNFETTTFDGGFANISSAPPTAVYYSTPNSTPMSNISSNYFSNERISMNEVSSGKPVNYDEARALVNLISDATDPLTIDRHAKEICKLNRDVYEIMLKTAANARK